MAIGPSGMDAVREADADLTNTAEAQIDAAIRTKWDPDDAEHTWEVSRRSVARELKRRYELAGWSVSIEPAGPMDGLMLIFKVPKK